jgi:hypothetical protein
MSALRATVWRLLQDSRHPMAPTLQDWLSHGLARPRAALFTHAQVTALAGTMLRAPSSSTCAAKHADDAFNLLRSVTVVWLQMVKLANTARAQRPTSIPRTRATAPRAAVIRSSSPRPATVIGQGPDQAALVIPPVRTPAEEAFLWSNVTRATAENSSVAAHVMPPPS